MTDPHPTLDSGMPEGGPKKRTPFVTVLCILSFVCIGYNVFSGALGALMHDEADLESAQTQLEETTEGLQGTLGANFFDGLMDVLTNLGEHAVTLNWILVLGNLICLAGVLMLWKMKKIGYLLYLIGHLAHVTAGVFLISGWYLGLLFWLTLFPILYAVNLKHMD